MLPQITIYDIIQFKRKNFNFKTQNKACYALACRIEGESLFFYNGAKRTVKRGEILFIPEGATYSQHCEEETIICFHLNISGQMSSELQFFSPPDPNKICEMFIEAERLWKKKPKNFELSCMSILYSILSCIDICSLDQPNDTSSLIEPAITYLNTHLFDVNLSIERVAKEAHVSRSYFNKLFFKSYGCTPTQYTNSVRIERAKQFLNSGGFSNDEIASLCGFNDVKYFYVIFKKITGLTTKEYKRDFDKLRSKNFVPGL